MIGQTISKNGCKIRLTEERWEHIIKSHQELEGLAKRILNAISAPDMIIKGQKEELIAVSKINHKFLIAIYKEDQPTGFIITAFITSKLKQIRKRGIIWEKKPLKK